jgi:hypothetical protein
MLNILKMYDINLTRHSSTAPYNEVFLEWASTP